MAVERNRESQGSNSKKELYKSRNEAKNFPPFSPSSCRDKEAIDLLGSG